MARTTTRNPFVRPIERTPSCVSRMSTWARDAAKTYGERQNRTLVGQLDFIVEAGIAALDAGYQPGSRITVDTEVNAPV